MNVEDLPALGDRALAIVRQAQPSTFAARKRLIAFRIVSGESIIAIARDTGIAPATIYKWLCNQDYKEYIDNLRSAVISESMGRLVDNSVRASDTLVALLDSADESIRLRASTSLIDILVKLRDHLEFARRIRVLEERYGNSAEGLEADGADDWDDGSGVAGLAVAPDGAAGPGPAAEALD
jgi:transposase-like protein